MVLRGESPGPSVVVVVERQERSKVGGLDRQLGGLALERGQLTVTTDPQDATDPADWNIVFAWESTPGNEADPEETDINDRPPAGQLPSIVTSNPDRVRPLIAAAVDGLTGMSDIETAALGKTTSHSEGVAVRIEFPAPRTGVPRSRQFRFARNFVEALLVSLDMIKEPAGSWAPNFQDQPIVGIYDAEGVGFRGSNEVERVIDETHLEVVAVPLGPEDIREGALKGVSAMVFPGGSGSAIARALEPEGVEEVRRAVSDGRGFLGICAGAYFANSGLPDYASMLPLNHHRPWRKGRGLVRVELTPEGREIFGDEFASFETRYNNGPIFTSDIMPVGDTPQHRVLAHFQSATTDKEGVTHEVMIGTPAILAGSWGQGRILTISPHPESHPELNSLVARALAWTLEKGPDQAR